MRSWNTMGDRLREHLASPRVIELPGCHDVASAILLEQANFEAVFLSGYSVAASYLGSPDIGLTTASETVTITRNVSNRIGIPLIVDADNGYGNEDNVLRTIHDLEAAGAAGIIMEDQVLPKRCGHTEAKRVVPLPHYMRKLECVLKGRQTNMVVIARTDVMVLDEAIERAKTFHAAGADVTLIDGLRSLDDMKRVADEVPGHKQINLIYGGKTPILSTPVLHEMGFKIVLYSTPALYVAIRAMREAFATLQKTHDLNSISDVSAPFRDVQSLLESVYEKRFPVASLAAKFPSLHPSDKKGGSGA